MSEIAVLLDHCRLIAKPYYEVSFNVDLSALTAQAGDCIQLHHDSLRAAQSLPIMQVYPHKNQITCLLKDNPQETLPPLFHSAQTSFSYFPQARIDTEENEKNVLIIAQNEYLASLILHAHLIPKAEKNKAMALFEIDGLCVFPIRPSSFIIPELNPAATAALALLEDWCIPSRIASRLEQAGCHHGSALELAKHWLSIHRANGDKTKLAVYGQTEFVLSFQALKKQYA